MDVDSPNSLKRCSSAPQINNLLPTTAVGHHHHSPIVPMEEGQSHQPEDNQSAASAQIKPGPLLQQHSHLNHQQQNSANSQLHSMSSSSTSSLQTAAAAAPHRESPPTSFSNIFAPRVRRFSASFSPLAVISNGSSSPVRSGSCTPGPRLTPRISQLRQEECADLSNSREVNHEREIHSAMQMSQSYEDLTLVTENWSFSSATNTKHNDDLINPLHVALPSIGTNYCSSPSPTSRAGLGLQYPTTSPSPTRKYVTRRSMSPCPIRPSPLSSVKRKFDLESGSGGGGEGGGNNYGNCYSPPPLKKIFTGADRGTSPVCQTPSPSPICPSPDSSTASFENGSNNASSGSGRITPKFFVTRLSASGQLFAGNGGGGGGGPPAAAALNPQLAAQVTTVSSGAIVTESPPSSSSSSSFMMMDCGVSSSSGGVGGAMDRKQAPAAGTSAVMTVSSSGEEGKIDCDEDITDLNVIGSSTSMATTESSEAAMEEVIKTTRALDSESELQLLDSRSSSVVSNCHRLSSSGSVGNVSSVENNNSADGSSSLCPLAANGSASTSSSFMAANIEIAET